MKKSPEIYLHDMLESITLIEKRMQGVTKKQFEKDIDLQDMVIRRIEIIGEAIRQLPGDWRKAHPDINWQDPADMRSALIHGYASVDLTIVWDTITHDLPPFKQKISELLKTL